MADFSGELREHEDVLSCRSILVKKAEAGHDINISFEEMKKIIGDELLERLKELSLEIYKTT